MSVLDYNVNIRGREEQELVAEQLDFGLKHRAIRGEAADTARRIIRKIVWQLLNRKRQSDSDRDVIRDRWESYL